VKGSLANAREGGVLVKCLALALLLAVSPDQYDTVVLMNGGILRGAVLEDIPGASLVLELASGEVWTIPRSEIARIDYARRDPPLVPGPYPVPPQEADLPGGPDDAGPPEEAVASLEQVRAFQAGVSIGMAIPVGRLDASGLGLGSVVSPQLTFTFEGSFRPMAELELGLYLLLGGGSVYAPLDGYCLAVGGSCEALDVSLGFFPRWSFLPRGAINPWVMVSGGLEWLSIGNDYQDGFDYTGWQLGVAVGVDIRFGPGFSTSLQLGTRWGQFTSLSVRGLLPNIGFEPATHGWIDFGLRGNYCM
jgi:hypothetical protein